jgi:hypothetical protein
MRRKISSPAGQGIRGSKPRLKPATNGEVSESELTRTYLLERNRQLLLKNQAKELELAKEAREWVSRKELEQESSVIFLAIKRKLLALPTKLRQKVGEDFSEAVYKAANDTVRQCLTELAALSKSIGEDEETES